MLARSLSPWQWASQVLSGLNVLRSLRVRETGSLGEAIVVSLRGILGSVVVMVLVLRGGLYLWKVHRKKKKKMETARGRWHFSFLPKLLPLPHWTLGALPPAFTSQGISVHRRWWQWSWPWGTQQWVEGTGFPGPDLSSILFVTQEQDCRRIMGSVTVASRVQN